MVYSSEFSLRFTTIGGVILQAINSSENYLPPKLQDASMKQIDDHQTLHLTFGVQREMRIKMDLMLGNLNETSAQESQRLRVQPQPITWSVEQFSGSNSRLGVIGLETYLTAIASLEQPSEHEWYNTSIYNAQGLGFRVSRPNPTGWGVCCGSLPAPSLNREPQGWIVRVGDTRLVIHVGRDGWGTPAFPWNLVRDMPNEDWCPYLSEHMFNWIMHSEGVSQQVEGSAFNDQWLLVPRSPAVYRALEGITCDVFGGFGAAGAEVSTSTAVSRLGASGAAGAAGAAGTARAADSYVAPGGAARGASAGRAYERVPPSYEGDITASIAAARVYAQRNSLTDAETTALLSRTRDLYFDPAASGSGPAASAGRASHGAASSEAPDMPLWDQYTDWYPLQGPGLRHLIAEHGRPVPPDGSGSSVAYRTVVEREAAALEAGVVEEADADEADAREVDREIETKYGYKTGSRKEMKRVNALLLDRMRIELTSKRVMQRKSIEKPECCICIRREATVALNPCGHVCLCEYCARGPNQLETCPICRTRCNVLPPLRIYMATPLPVSDSNIIPFL